MRRRVRFHPAALEDVAGAVDWYAQRSLRTAQRFLDELEHVIGLISTSPGRFQSTDPGIRRAVFRRFPHYAVFQADEETVEILALAHGKRRPGFWRDRMI